MKRLYATIMMTVCILNGYAQSSVTASEQERELQKDEQFINQKQLKDDRDIVGVAAFKCDQESKFTSLVTEKVVEVLKNSNRFIVVDRTNRDKVVEELEYQKNEAFIGKDVAEQGSSLAAKRIVNGTITKIPIYRIKNPDGSVRGYKASVAFQLKVDDIATQQTTEARSFEGKASDECISPEAAVQMAMNSLQEQLAEYFRVTFPLYAKVVKILTEKKGKAETILIKAGSKHGVKVGDKFIVELIEEIEGEEIPTVFGKVTVTKLTGQAFSECKVDKAAAQPLFEQFRKNANIRCSLIIKR